jgi:uncharacterized protein (TIGR01244 family)
VIDPGVAAAGQPSVEALGRLKEMGFKTVVNLRTAAEAPVVAEEKKAVEAQGLRYLAVPITPDTFSAADVEAVQKVLDDPSAGPVLLHCASANRVGAVWGVIERRRGRNLEEAEREAKKAGLTSEPMTEAFRRVAGEEAQPPIAR